MTPAQKMDAAIAALIQARRALEDLPIDEPHPDADEAIEDARESLNDDVGMLIRRRRICFPQRSKGENG